MKLLVVDDEAIIRETLETKFRREGFEVLAAASAEEGLTLYRRENPAIIILDIMLPQRSGYDFCIAVRRESTVPIIILSAKASETNRIQGLELGADDYLPKPFHLNELAARVKAVLRRSGAASPSDSIAIGTLRINPGSHEATLSGRPLPLSPKAFALLLLLVSHEGQVMSREHLLDRVWGPEADQSTRTVDVHIHGLRRQIEEDPASPKHLVTVRGIGYRFNG